jgi:YhcH/YjgK/YiaL family protein
LEKQKYSKAMIIDQLENSRLYAAINVRLAVALSYIQNYDLASLEIGRHPIEEDDIFALVSEYETKDLDNSRWEAHQKYADIQLLISGEEKMGVASPKGMKVNKPYNPEKDIEFYDGKGDYVILRPGNFAVVFPSDAHLPGIRVDEKVKVRKVVIKVRL